MGLFAVVLALGVGVCSAQRTPSASNCFGRGEFQSSTQYTDTRVPFLSNNTSARQVIANGSCTCSDPQYIGPECANIACPNNCGHSSSTPHGECMSNDAHSSVCYCFENGGIGSRRGSACELTPCISDCNGHGRCAAGVCQCYAGYDGTACQTSVAVCNHGSSIAGGLCTCDEGWSGPKCNLRTCPFNCHATHGQGLCVNGTCACTVGFIGEVCEHTICPGQCSRRGTCNRATGRCMCQHGYTGNDCSQETCVGGCGLHGNCTGTTCTCDDGWTGGHCELPACPHNCTGNGVCRHNTCFCHKGWTGKHCESLVCPLNCSGHGVCDASTEQCLCSQGFHGFACEFTVCHHNEDMLEGLCSGNGYCEDTGVCSCREGWGGPKCNVRRCPASCNGMGVCNDGVCDCLPSRGGNDCGTPICPKHCSGNGHCITPPPTSNTSAPSEPYCNCSFPYIGEDCSKTTCPSGCSGNGFCWDGKCFCEAGWGGSDCDIQLCQCNGHGTCQDGASECFCTAGWQGASCNERVCPQDCLGNGLCNRTTGECKCNPNTAGKNCSARCPSSNDVAYDGGLLCSGHGQCNEITGLCGCEPGWGGADCGYRTCGACSEHGMCGNGTAGSMGSVPMSHPPSGQAQAHAHAPGHGNASNRTNSSRPTSTEPTMGCYCRPGWMGMDCSSPVPMEDTSPTCACGIKCSMKCLDTCRGIAETKNIDQGHNCFLNCGHLCRLNCQIKGKPSIEGFSEAWAQPDYFAKNILPDPVIRQAANEEAQALVQDSVSTGQRVIRQLVPVINVEGPDLITMD